MDINHKTNNMLGYKEFGDIASGEKYSKNQGRYYVEPAKIVKAVETSNQPPYPGAQWTINLALRVTYHVGSGQGYEISVTHGGDAEFDLDGNLKDWGRTGWKLDRFAKDWGLLFGANSIPKLNPNAPHIPSEFIQYLVGLEGAVLRYVKGLNEEGDPVYGVFEVTKGLSSYTRDGNLIKHNIEGVTKQLKELFNASVKRGYPKNYDPTCLQESPPTTPAAPVTYVADPTDGLPF